MGGRADRRDRPARMGASRCAHRTRSVLSQPRILPSSAEQCAAPTAPGDAKLSTTPPLASKLPALSAALTTALLDDLGAPTNRKSGVVRLTGLLLRLHAGPAARAAFLAARTEAMRRHVRAIRFEGHIGAYVGDLALVCFTGIKHTADWFLASFKENEVASCMSIPC